MLWRLDAKPHFSFFQKKISPGGKLPLEHSRDPKSTFDKGNREQSPKAPLASSQPFLHDFIQILNNSESFRPEGERYGNGLYVACRLFSISVAQADSILMTKVITTPAKISYKNIICDLRDI